jgi:hypothetical protein
MPTRFFVKYLDLFGSHLMSKISNMTAGLLMKLLILWQLYMHNINGAIPCLQSVNNYISKIFEMKPIMLVY